MSDFMTYLSPAETERLAILLEELGEAQQAIGKILRHGYRSCHPLVVDSPDTNRTDLERELGHVYFAIQMLCSAKDIRAENIRNSAEFKKETVKRWLHYQEQCDGNEL